jgi:hypothetical protein
MWHPVEQGGRYEFQIEPDWLRAVAPYIVVLMRLLKLVVPVVGPWVGLADADYADKVKHQVATMERLVAALPEDIKRSLPGVDQLDPGSTVPTRLEGASLRTLRVLLEALDPVRDWGGLSRVLTPEGHVLWLCGHHSHEYAL